MKIGIIGTGAFGSILTEKLSKEGHQVKVTNTRNIQELTKIATSLGATPATLQDVVKDVDVIIFAIPFKMYKHLPKNLLQDVSKDVVILDTSNYYPQRDGELADLEGRTESEYISETLGRPVVKVFSNILENTLKYKGKAASEEGRLALPIAGDNEEHKEIAAELVNQIGFDAVDGGSLAQSWRQEPGTPAYCTELSAIELKQALGAAEKGKAPAIRDYLMKKFLSSKTMLSDEAFVALNRSAHSGHMK